MKFLKRHSVKIKEKISKKLPKLPKWAIITIILGLILVISLGAYFTVGRVMENKAATAMSTYTVQRMNLENTITGSGSIEPNDQYELTSLVKGEILETNFEEGDMVEKGDVMYVIDSSDQESAIKKAENSLKQAQNSYRDALEDYDDLTTESTVTGTVTAVYVEEGEIVNTNTRIMDVINNTYMTLNIPFIAQDADNISVGQTAKVNVEGSYTTLSGRVTYITSGSVISSEGVKVKNIEIEVKNPGAIEEGDKATAIVGKYACNASGTFENSEKITILSKGSGEIIEMPYRVGDWVRAGDTVIKVSSDSIGKQIENAQLSLDNAEISYENTLDQMENYTITAPISGTVIQKNSKTGDTIDNTTATTSMAVIADMSRMTFDISIDELDIQLLEVGQKATVTADAFEGQIFTGTVDYISVIGTTSNGVTTYPVTIVLDDAGELLPGMNVDASIVVESSANTLAIPIGAVRRGNIVYVKGNTSDSKANQGEMPRGNIPDGYSPVEVTIGINNDSYIEILSGLKEGDVVYVQAAAQSTSENEFTGMPGGMPGGIGGGMPTGGRMPGAAAGIPSGGGMPAGSGGMMR